MPNVNFANRIPPVGIGGVVPKYANIPTWRALTGMSRSRTYVLLSGGKLRAIKMGKQTLIDCAHGFAYLESLPLAEIRIGESS